MKIITIGRGEGCTIQIDNEFISRQHAIIRVYPTGKMELIDKSSNGTAINGRPLKPNTPYRVRRKDVVTFAGQAQLVWSDIPDPLKPWKIAAICLLVALAIIGGLYAFRGLFPKKPAALPPTAPPAMTAPAPKDTTKTQPQEPAKEAGKKSEDPKKDDELRKAIKEESKKAAQGKKKAETKKKQEAQKKAKSDTSNMSLF